MMNRLGNAHNPHQGNMKKVLCVCSAGLLRSPTIAFVLSNPPWNCNTRAAGVSKDYALIIADLPLVEWADEIVCASDEHVPRIQELLKQEAYISKPNKPVHCLNIPDEHKSRSPELIRIIESSLKHIGFKGTQ